MLSIYEEGDRTDPSNYHGTSFLAPAYKTLSDILLARLSPIDNEIIGEYLDSRVID